MCCYYHQKSKKQHIEWEKIFQVIQHIRNFYPEYLKNSYNTTIKTKRNFKQAMDLDRHYSKENKQIANNHMKIWPKKSNTVLSYSLAIPPLGINPKDLKIYSHKNLYMNVHSNIHNSQKCKQPKCPSTDKWVNKMWSIHLMDYYLAIRRNDVLIHDITWMNLVNAMLSKRSQTQNSRYCVISTWTKCLIDKLIYRKRK